MSMLIIPIQYNGSEGSLQSRHNNNNSFEEPGTNSSSSDSNGIDLNQYQKAIELYDKALVVDPNNTDTIANKGIAFILLQEYVEASKLLDDALALDPNHTASLFYKGIVLDKLGKHRDAIRYYNMASEADPNYTGELINRVESLKEDYKVDTSRIRLALNITQQSGEDKQTQ